MKVLVATEKPFAKTAVDGIREIFEKAHFEVELLPETCPLKPYSTVTDFAKFLGWSTSRSLTTAMW